MLRYLCDEHVHGEITRALQRRLPDLDVVRAQDTELYGGDDPSLLEYAAREGRIILTNDFATLIGFAYARVKRGESMTGVFALHKDAGLGQLIDDLLLLAIASAENEWADRVIHVPLR